VDTDGDFQFRRRKSSRLATRSEAAAGPDVDMTVIATPEELATPAATATKPQRKAASLVPETPVVKAKPVSLPLDSPTPPPPRATRRKKEKKKEDQNVDEMRLERPSSPPPAPTTRSRKPDKRRRNEKAVEAANAAPEHDASHDDAWSRVIQLPTSDTPMQRRNQELRRGSGATGSSRRRSSLGMRGRRASSMMQSGLVGMT
jgi:kinetochore protein Mis13/DSN1